MKNPSMDEALFKEVKSEVKAEVVEKEAKGPSDVGSSVVSKEATAQTLETIEEEEHHASDGT